MANARELLETLQAEVWWPGDRMGDREGGYPNRPQRPYLRPGQTTAEFQELAAAFKTTMDQYWADPRININRWKVMTHELMMLQPHNPMIAELHGLYADGRDTRPLRLERQALLAALLETPKLTKGK